MSEHRSSGHLRVYRQGDQFVLYNPSAPTWVHTNATGAISAKLLDGSRTFNDVAEICAANGVDGESVRAFLASADAAELFKVWPPSRRWETLEWRSRRIGAIYLHLTNKCNLECSYCYRGSSPRQSIKHKGSDFISFFKQAAPILARRPKITFSGGEPMIHPDFFEVAHYCNGAGMSCELLTNGLFVTSENAAEIARCFGYVKISVDGASEDVHSRTRGVGNFARVLDAIAVLAAQPGLRVAVQMTLHKENLRDPRALRALVPDNVDLKFTPAMPMGRAHQETEERISNEEFIAVDEDQMDPTEGRGTRHLDKGMRTFGCHAGLSSISISDRGDVYPCHLFHRNEFKLGNIFENAIDDIFYSDRNQEFSKSMDVEKNNQRCAGCDFRYLCGGGCKANPLHASGDFHKSDTYCTFIRKSLVNGMFAEANAQA